MTVIVPFVPQPIPNVCKPGTWHWIYSTERAATFIDPEDSWVIANSPFTVGCFYGEHVIESIGMDFSFEEGWVWNLTLRESRDDELEGYWELILAPRSVPPTALVCEQCGATEGVRLVPAMTAYADEERNRASLFCGPCTDDYTSFWQEMWDNYHASIGV